MKIRLIAALLSLLPLSASAAGIAHHFNGRWGALEVYDARSGQPLNERTALNPLNGFDQHG